MKCVHTCYRVFDLDRSLDFLTNKLGLELTHKSPAGDEATNVFLTVPSSAGFLLPADSYSRHIKEEFGQNEPRRPVDTWVGHALGAISERC